MKNLYGAVAPLWMGIGVWAVCAPFLLANAQTTPGGVTMQPPNSATAEQVQFFHNMILLPIISVICLFVLALLVWVIVRYNSKANPNPRKFSHNTLVEVLWTGVPIMILLIIALPSFDLLFTEGVTPDGKQSVMRGDGRTQDFVFANDFPASRMVHRPKQLQVLVDDGSGAQLMKNRIDYVATGFGEPEILVSMNAPPAAGARVILRGGRSVDQRGDVTLAPTMTLKVTGVRWYWNYAYPDFGDFDFVSNMAVEEDTTPELYRLEVDNRVVVPVGETIRLTVTGSDVIHAWALPAFAIKIDAVPGRVNETWFKADREGVFYGQCSEICGIRHAFMPIAVEVVSRPVFEAWIDSQRALAGMGPMFETNNVKVAQGVIAGAAAE